jgi:hypothetical protein
MTMRSRRETVHFRHPFRIKGIDRQLAPGAYEVITDEEMIEGFSFPCFACRHHDHGARCAAATLYDGNGLNQPG